MTDKRLVYNGTIGGDFFSINYTKIKKGFCIEELLNRFNIDDYWIYKSTDKSRIISKEDFYKFKYSKYIFFLKTKYNSEDIDEWIKFIKDNEIMIKFISNKFPDISIRDKIKIMDNL
jgi:hypothetical protein